MKIKKIKDVGLRIGGILILFVLWDVLSLIFLKKYGSDFALPGVRKTALAFFRLITTADYWKTIAFSVLRILEGLIIGTFVGLLLSVLVYRFQLMNAVISPLLTVVRSTPVVSFILILWVAVSDKNLVPSMIAALMVVPVVYGQLQVGFLTLDSGNMELLELYGIKGKRKINDFVLPALLPHFFSAVLTCSGLAWKAGVSAEVIVYAKNSIGQKMFDAKTYVTETPVLFAWTLSVILISVLFERLILRLKKEAEKREHKTM